MLRGKRVLVGITGSIAAYKACDLIQRLKENGCEVRVAMTPEAAQLVHPHTLGALSGFSVLTDAWSGVVDGRMDHIAWARWAEVFFIAPATAHTLAELAHGLTSHILSLLALVFTGRVIVAPAMNTQMLHHPATQANLRTLADRGVVILPTGEGTLACGEVGEGKLLAVNSLVAHLKTCLSQPSSPLPHLRGKKVLLALGHTRESIDDVRFISNRSSGKTGFALARALWLAGAEVHAIIGHVDEAISGEYASVVGVSSSQDFQREALQKAPAMDVIILSAAIADFTPTQPKSGKIKDSKALKNIELSESPHILAELGKRKSKSQILVGFALETENLLEEASRKLRARNCDWVIVNNPVSERDGFGKDDVMAGILGLQGLYLPLQTLSKEALASHVLAALETSLSAGTEIG